MEKENAPKSMSALNGEVVEQRRYEYFDTTVEVVYTDTNDSTSPCQTSNVEAFFQRQNILGPKIAAAIFEYYKTSYPDYREGWTSAGLLSEKELEKSLPKPTTAQALMKFYTPLSIYVQNAADCADGSIGVAFATTWDAKSDAGVKITNWKDIEVGTQHVAFFP